MRGSFCVVLPDPCAVWVVRTRSTASARGVTLVHVEVDRGMSWEAAEAQLAELQREAGGSRKRTGFWRSNGLMTGHHHVVLVDWLGGGKIRTWKPHVGGPNIRDVGEFRSLYAKLAPSEAREQWQLLYDDAARDETSLAPRRSTHFILTGEIFKVWLAADDASLRSTDRHVTLTRTSVTETGERIVGLAVHPDAVERVRKSVAEIEQSSDPELDHAAVAEVEESSEPPIDPKLFKELERSCEALVKKATKRAALLSKEAEDLDDDFI